MWPCQHHWKKTQCHTHKQATTNQRNGSTSWGKGTVNDENCDPQTTDQNHRKWCGPKIFLDLLSASNLSWKYSMCILWLPHGRSHWTIHCWCLLHRSFVLIVPSASIYEIIDSICDSMCCNRIFGHRLRRRGQNHCDRSVVEGLFESCSMRIDSANKLEQSGTNQLDNEWTKTNEESNQ